MSEPLRDDGITVGGALTAALAMSDLEPVVAPIATRGQLITLTAQPGHGKSTLMTSLFMHYVLGRSYGPMVPTFIGFAYFVSAEDLQGTRNRLLAQAAHMRLDAHERGLVNDILRWVQVDAYATASGIAEAIRRDIGAGKAGLIFVDTGPALFNGDDENDNVALRNFVEGFRIMADLPGQPATILAWHPSKGAGADRLEPRGASAIKGSIDANLTLWREDDRVTISYTKVRGEHFDPIEGTIAAVEMESGSGRRYTAPVITLDDANKPERSDVRAIREDLMRELYADRLRPMSVRELAANVGKPRSTVHRHLERLSEARLVKLDAVSGNYALTKAGETRAKEVLCPTT